MTNILLVTKKDLSFDKNLSGDFELKKNLLNKNDNKDFIYIGCQILNKNLLKKRQKINFPINEIWDELLEKRAETSGSLVLEKAVQDKIRTILSKS